MTHATRRLSLITLPAPGPCPPAAVLAALIGRTNDRPCLGHPAGHVRFEGCRSGTDGMSARDGWHARDFSWSNAGFEGAGMADLTAVEGES
jgi:hypothetical protein